MQNGLLTTLRERLTHVASIELDVVLSLLQDVSLSTLPDERLLTHGKPFSPRDAYALLSPVREVDCITPMQALFGGPQSPSR